MWCCRNHLFYKRHWLSLSSSLCQTCCQDERIFSNMCRVVARFVIPISTFLMWTWVCYINVCLNVYAAQGHSQDGCTHLCLIKASAVGPFHAIAQWESPPCTWLCLSYTCVFKHICCASSIVHNCCCGVSTVLTIAFSHPLLWYIFMDS